MIMPYFGSFPIWFDLYLYSCSLNDFIDFLFITDNKIHKKYSNTKFINCSFEDYCSLISSKLGFEFNPKSPYKLCDVRPFYAIVHEEYIKNYTFWGYGDIDLVYGDLSIILNEERMSRYDFITSHADRLAGHFTIIRNNIKCNELCFKIDNWVERLKDEYVYGFDEHDLTKIVFPIQPKIWILYRVIGKHFGIIYYNFFNAFNCILNKVTKRHMHEYLTSILPKDNEIWDYNLEKGKIINPEGKEIPYLHFLFFKKTKFYPAEHYWKDNYWHVKQSTIEKKGERHVFFTNLKVYDEA